MKQILLYGITTLTLLLCGCTKTQTDDVLPQGEGSLQLSVRPFAGTGSGEYNPLDYCIVRIYGQEGLVRRYESLSDIPDKLWLLSGSYIVRVEAGDMSAASFTHKSYRGEQEFVVTAGAETAVEVKCTLLNTAVSVEFDQSVLDKYLAMAAGVCIGDTYDSSLIDAGKGLSYQESATGYFLLPAGETNLSWSFAAFSLTGNDISRRGTIAGVKPGAHYTLTFRYSKDKGGIIDFSLSVNETTDDFDDIIVFDPDATADLEGEGFDVSQPQPYLTGEVSYFVSTPTEIGTLSVAIEGRTYELVTPATATAARTGSASDKGITVSRIEAGRYRVAFGQEFFATLPGGDHTMTFTVTETSGHQSKADAVVVTQGIVPVTEADYNLWSNRAVLRARVLDSAATDVKIALRKTDGAWQELTATPDTDGLHTATFAPSWSSSQNENGLTVYTVDPETGIFPERSYECRVLVDGIQAGTSVKFAPAVSQPVPYGDMEDGSLSCFTSANTTSLAWGSGNNAFTPLLCTWSTFAGMGDEHCAALSPGNAYGVFAAGNLFLGQFKREGLGGYVDFGQPYTWDARPTALRLKYHATVGPVDNTRHTLEDGTNPLEKGEQDITVVYVAIVDWQGRHRVTSGLSSCSGMWLPDAVTKTDEGAIIGYGILRLREDTEGARMVETTIPIRYYDHQAKPSKQIQIVIAASTSLYGDYLCGCSTNKLYLDDFKWVY